MSPLTETRATDRAVMAERIARLAEAHGAAIEIETGWPSARAITVHIRAARGLLLMVDFDGESPQPNVHVLSWHMSTDVDTCLSSAFGDVNGYHFRKATDVAYGIEQLCEILARRLDRAADGSAFSGEREAERIAEAGETAAQRNARYDLWLRPEVKA